MNNTKLNIGQSVRQQLWMELLVNEEGFTEEAASLHVQNLIALLRHMQSEYAIFAYRRKSGEVELMMGTLIPYPKWFKKPFTWENLHRTIPIWNAETKKWTTFDMANFLQWKNFY